MQNIEVRIHVKLEVKVPIKIFLRNFPLSHHYTKNITHAKISTPTKNFDRRKKNGPMQKNFDPSKPPKNYDPRKDFFNPRNPRKSLTHATHTPM